MKTQQIKLVPHKVMTVDGGMSEVIGTVSYPPGHHPPHCPLLPELTALEVKTNFGSRWYGVEKAWIGSDLQMHVKGFDFRFEEMMAWKNGDAIGEPLTMQEKQSYAVNHSTRSEQPGD